MYKNRLAYFLLVSMLLPTYPSARAAEIHQGVSQTCTLQIEETEQRLSDIADFNLVQSGTAPYKASDAGRPVYTTHSVYFVVEKAGGENLMNSPKLMKKIATDLFAQCQSAGSVIFGMNIPAASGRGITSLRSHTSWFDSVQQLPSDAVIRCAASGGESDPSEIE